MSTDDHILARELLLGALRGLYGESPGLVGNTDLELLGDRALRANERAVAARLAVHIDRALAVARSQLTVDVEYSRVFLGIDPKRAKSRQIFPDLIVHRRGEGDRNLLAVELKPGVPTDRDAVDANDDRKIRQVTTAGWMAGQSAYVRGVCLQLAHNRARLHWYEAGRLTVFEDWTPVSSSLP